MNEKRSRGEGRIFLRGKVQWIQFYDARGKKIRESTGEIDEKKAGKILRARLGQVAAGIHRDARHLRYGDLRAKLLADYETQAQKSLRRDADGNPMLPTVARLDKFFSGFRVSEIDSDSIRKFIKHEQVRKKGNGTINRALSALRRAFNIARQDGALRDVPHFSMLKEPPPREGYLEVAEYEKLSRALPDYLRLPLAIGFFSGMRLAEILALTWSQVDFVANTITLAAGTTKNDEGRVIPIVPQLRSVLVEQRGKRQPECDFVCFRFNRNGRAIQITAFGKAWRSACVKAGLGKMEPVTDTAGKPVYATPRPDRRARKPKAKMVYRGLIFHDLRRSAVRNMVNAGVPERVAMKISGHKTRAIFDRYHIVAPSDLLDAGRKLAAYHDEKFGHNSGTIEARESQVSPLLN